MAKDTYWKVFSRLKQRGLLRDEETIEFLDIVKLYMDKKREAEKEREKIYAFLNRYTDILNNSRLNLARQKYDFNNVYSEEYQEDYRNDELSISEHYSSLIDD